MNIAAARNFILLAAALALFAPPASAILPVSREFRELQQKSVTLAAEAQSKERALNATEKELAALDAEKQKKDEAIRQRSQHIQTLMQGLVKLGSVPPEVAAAMPDQYGDEVRTASVLKATTDSLREEKAALEKQRAEITALEKGIAERRDMLVKESAQLKQSLDALREQLKTRQAMHGSLRGGYTAERTKIAAQSGRSSSNVGTLLRALEKAPPEKPATLRPFAAAKGQAQLPAAGKLVRRFGERDALGGVAKGITLQTRKEAPVTAPFDGEVVYAGEFLGYGQMVILRHVGGYHSLLAGLASIECVPGQLLLEGEPVGMMGGNAPENTSLYVEFRSDGTPIDPLPWLKGTASLARN